jgi:hypothetical protein
MRIRPFVLPVIAGAVVLLGPVLGYQAAVHAGTAVRTRHVYRLDYAITLHDHGKPPVTSVYALNVEEDSHGELRAGANVPLVVGTASAPQSASPRQDVGVKLDCQLARAGADILLRNHVELSGVADANEPGPRTIHRIDAHDDVVIAPGKTALVANIEEPTTHARYEVTVTATKLR